MTRRSKTLYSLLGLGALVGCARDNGNAAEDAATGGVDSSGMTGGAGGSGGAASPDGSSGTGGMGGATVKKDASATAPPDTTPTAGPDGRPGWIQLFNGKDLTGWKAKITQYAYGDNYANTFRVEDGKIKVLYDQYKPYSFDGKFGLLYYEKPFSKYIIRVEYHFTGPQAPNPPGWGLRNSGLMIIGENPAGVGKDVDFPRIFEIQLLGRDNSGGSNNGNLCLLGGASAILGGQRQSGGCLGSTSIPFSQNPNFANDAWVTVQAEVDGSGETRVSFDGDNGGKPINTWSMPMANGMLLDSGYIALQSESHPIEFRKVELKDLTK